MTINKQILITMAGLVSGSALAGTMGTINAPAVWSPVIGISAGPAWTSRGQNKTFYLQSDVQKAYVAKKSSQTIASGDLFLGMQHRINARFLGQFGFDLAAATGAKQIGDIWEDADPELNNFSYKYKINHQHLAVKGKLLADLSASVMPYVSASAGFGTNRAHDFTINPKLFSEVPAPSFQNKSTTTFVYTLGIGVQKMMNSYWQIGVGYEFSDWGKSQLARAPGQTVNSGLSLSKLYANSIQFSLSYVA